jgi:hypothetical protein
MGMGSRKVRLTFVVEADVLWAVGHLGVRIRTGLLGSLP